MSRFTLRLLAGTSARRGVIVSAACATLQSACVVAGAAALATAISGVFAHGDDLAREAVPVAVFGGALALRSLLVWLAEASGHVAAAAAVDDVRRGGVRRALAPGDTRSDIPTGETATLLTSGVDLLDHYFGRYLPQLVTAFAVPVVAVAYVLSVDWLSAVILVLTLPTIPLFMGLIGRYAEQRTRRRWETFARLGAHFLDVLQGLPTLRIFGRGPAQVQRIRDISERLRASTMATLRIAFVSAFALELLSSLGVALLAVTIAVRLVGGSLDLRSGLTVLILAPEVYLPLRTLGASYHSSMEGVAAARRLSETAPPAGVNDTVMPARITTSAIRLQHVTFTHPGRSTGIRDLSFEIARGQRVVLCGPSGAGKTTVLALVLGHLRPDAGDVATDGGEAVWLPQHPHLFSGTIADNVTLGDPRWSGDEVRAALAAAGATFVDSLPSGLDTSVGDRGLTLSGGQRQRVALARVLVRTAPTLLLDEPLANLDSARRALVSAEIERATRGRTVIIAAHAIEQFAWADAVITLQSAGGESPAEAMIEAVRS